MFLAFLHLATALQCIVSITTVYAILWCCFWGKSYLIDVFILGMPISTGKGSGLRKPGKQVLDQGWRKEWITTCHCKTVTFLVFGEWKNHHSHPSFFYTNDTIVCNVSSTDHLLRWVAVWDRWLKLTHLEVPPHLGGLAVHETCSICSTICHYKTVWGEHGHWMKCNIFYFIFISLQGKGVYQDCNMVGFY